METSAISGAVLVAIIYPILTIIASEVQRSLERRKSLYAKAVRLFQITVMPMAALYILLALIAGIDVFPKDEAGAALPLSQLPVSVILTKIILTATAIFTINALLTALNAFLLSQRNTSSFLANIPGLLLDLLRLALVLIGAAIIVSTVWGADLQGALVGLGVGGIVLGLALQDTLSAVFAGLSMVSTRTFKEGDWLKTGDYEGRVIAMDWRSVTIETEQKILAVVPNSELAQSTFIVESSDTMPYGEEVALFLSYDDAPEKVIEIIDAVAASIPGILSEPAHEVEVLNFADTGIEYELMFFVPDRGDAWRVRSDFLRRFWYAAKRAGLHHTGAQNLYFQTIEKDAAAFKDRHEWLANLSVFSAESQGFDELVKASKAVSFGRDEIIMAAGATFDLIYIPYKGSLNICDFEDKIIQSLSAGSFFISRAFLNGGDCPVTLQADGECQLLAIGFQDLLTYTDKNPNEAGRLEQLIEQMEDGIRGRSLRQGFGTFDLAANRDSA